MTPTAPPSPRIGDIRYEVYCSRKHGAEPWLCRLRLESASPAGRSHRWRLLDAGIDPTTGETPLEARYAIYPLASTVDDAVIRFQRHEMMVARYQTEEKCDLDERLRLILAAEALRGRDAGEGAGQGGGGGVEGLGDAQRGEASR